MNTHKKGFTLIEIIIVIAIIAILASAVIIAINPARVIKQAANSTRLSHMYHIANGIYAFVVDNRGTYPNCLYSNASTGVRYIYNAASSTTNWGLNKIADPTTGCSQLLPLYLPKYPADPQAKDYLIGFMGDASTSDRIIIRSNAADAIADSIYIIQ